MTAIQRATLDELIAARASAIRWSNAASVATLTAEINRRLLTGE